MGKITISMAIFNSYVKLPEGKLTHITWLTFGFGFTWGKPQLLSWCVNPGTYSYIPQKPKHSPSELCINLSRFRCHPWTSAFRQRHLVGELWTQHRKEVHSPINDHLDPRDMGKSRSSPTKMGGFESNVGSHNYWDQMWDRTTKCHQMVWYLKMGDLRILAMLLCWLI